MGEQIKLVRLRRILSAELVAERAGISRASLWKIEKGEGIDIDIFIGGNRYGVIDLKKYTGCWRNNRS